jgi:hypothetical protein
MLAAVVALSVVCATADVNKGKPAVAKIEAPARMATIANIVIVLIVDSKWAPVYKVIFIIFLLLRVEGLDNALWHLRKQMQ